MENFGKKEIVFSDYFNLVVQRPELAQFSGQRIAAALRDENLPVAVAEFFKAGAAGLNNGNRMMVMVGEPNDTTQIMDQIVTGFAKYSSSETGIFYAIEGCPLKEEPLRLIPQRIRRDFPEFPGLSKIKGEPCPDCDKRFLNWRIEDIPLEIHPPEAQVQSPDNCTSTFEYRGQGAEQLIKAMVKANRGLLVGKGLFGVDAPMQILYPFLPMTESGIKVPRSPISPLDIVAVATATREEYNHFSKRKTQEALHDRVISVWL